MWVDRIYWRLDPSNRMVATKDRIGTKPFCCGVENTNSRLSFFSPASFLLLHNHNKQQQKIPRTESSLLKKKSPLLIHLPGLLSLPCFVFLLPIDHASKYAYLYFVLCCCLFSRKCLNNRNWAFGWRFDDQDDMLNPPNTFLLILMGHIMFVCYLSMSEKCSGQKETSHILPMAWYTLSICNCTMRLTLMP